MSGVWGMNVKMSIFGESHGKAIGIVLDGLPPGIYIDEAKITAEMQRRAPGKNTLGTARKETDAFEIQSGVFKGYTTGTPLCARILNNDQHSKDYSVLNDKMRPGHADYAGKIHYQGFNDYRGGGHFSGRLTAPLVFAGAIAKQALAKYKITIGAHILKIHHVSDTAFDYLTANEEEIENLARKVFPVLDDKQGEKMQQAILQAKEQQNSVGGVIELIALNLPVGLGAPYFDSVESHLSHGLFSVPAVKGVEFGLGFDFATLTGKEANDELYYKDNKVCAYTNNNGGITGGLTNGMPLIFRTVIKPTPSISQIQKTVSLSNKCDTTIVINGRHDPCIVQRAVPVIEAITAWVIWDLLLEAKKWER